MFRLNETTAASQTAVVVALIYDYKQMNLNI